MGTKMKCLILLLLQIAFISPVLAGVVVSGEVLAQDGRPVTGAWVAAFPISAEGSAGDIHWIKTDESARFQLDLSKGRYLIRAKDEADGYPDPSFRLNLDSSRKFPEIEITDKALENVDVVLGARGGFVSGVVDDADTHQALAGTKIRFQDAQDSDTYVEVFTDREGHFKYTVPSKPILISAVASGYKGTAFNNGAAVTLSPGEHRSIDIELEHERQ